VRIGVLGTGTVGRTIAGRLEELGHEVRAGSRGSGDYAEASEHGELVFNCTAGAGAVDAVTKAAAGLEGKVLVDVSNPLRFDDDGPTLFTGIDDSLGEQVQRAVPGARVVKALNTVNADVMVHPEIVPGEHLLFVCGEDVDAKAMVTELLGEFGWPAERVVDAGGIAGARAAEAYLLIGLRLMGGGGGSQFNIAVQRKK